MNDRTALFPYPHVVDKETRDGSIVSWPKTCVDCKTRECEQATGTDLKLCAFGYNFQRLDAHTVVAGIVVREFNGNTPARQKRLREVTTRAVARDQLAMAADTYLAFSKAVQEDVSEEKRKLLRDYANSEQYRIEFLRELRPDIQRGLALFHDYKQINRQISQNINVIIEQSYSGETLPEKLARAKPAERSIYEAAKFLEEKLNVAKFLLSPEWLEERSACTRFRFHGLVSKYLHIYGMLAERKKVTIVQVGASYLETVANAQAVSVIPHTLIDNAIKYAPTGSLVKVELHDRDDFIDFGITSWGPAIRPSEEDRIFDLFYRGQAAQKQTDEGSGYGLYVSQLVAKVHLGTEVTVEQRRSHPLDDRYETEFSVTIPLRALILDR